MKDKLTHIECPHCGILLDGEKHRKCTHKDKQRVVQGEDESLFAIMAEMRHILDHPGGGGATVPPLLRPRRGARLDHAQCPNCRRIVEVALLAVVYREADQPQLVQCPQCGHRAEIGTFEFKMKV